MAATLPESGPRIVTSQRPEMGTSDGPELLIQLGGTRRRALLEQRLRELIRDGTLAASSRLPSSRALAGDLGVSRRLVVDAYAQLLAEGYLVARRGAGTYVAGAAEAGEPAAARSPPRPLQFDFFPGYPDLSSFPRRAWGRALRSAVAEAPDSAFG